MHQRYLQLKNLPLSHPSLLKLNLYQNPKNLLSREKSKQSMIAAINRRESKVLLVIAHLKYDTLKLNQIVRTQSALYPPKKEIPAFNLRIVCISADTYNSKGEKVRQIVDLPIWPLRSFTLKPAIQETSSCT